ncbi:MAG: cyclic pyranopterin monophosphate synthase MoaC [Bacteroidales bacterium]
MKKIKNSGFTHLDSKGEVKMVDVGGKPIQRREARACGKIVLERDTIKLITGYKIEKGSVLTIAKVAGIMAAKRCSESIPLCHPLIINVADISFSIDEDSITAESFISCDGNTGAEMEALSAVNGALLTIYDMCKAVDKNMVITDVRLLSKEKKSI